MIGSKYYFLFSELVRRDISSRYRGSVMGVLWAFVGPLLMLAIYTFVFSVIFQARWSTDINNKTAFAMNLFIGIILHGIFAESMSRSPQIILQNTSYVKKIIFPLWLLPIVPVFSAVFHAVISTFALLITFLLLKNELSLHALLLPLAFLPIVLFSLGLSWFLAGVGVYLRDISQVMPMFITILMFMAPIFYPVTAIPEDYQHWLYLNPLTYAVEMARGLLFTQAFPSLFDYSVYFLVAILTAVCGFLFFSKVRKGFADVL